MLWSTPGTQLRKHALFEHIYGTESKRVTLLENIYAERQLRPPLHGALEQRGRKQLYMEAPFAWGREVEIS